MISTRKEDSHQSNRGNSNLTYTSESEIRENAAIELPHVMLLVDDPIDRQRLMVARGLHRKRQ